MQEHQVKDGTALEFFIEVLQVLKAEKGGSAVVTVIKKSGVEARLMEFFPSVNQQQTEENFAKTFLAKELPEVVTFRKAQFAQTIRNDLQRAVRDAVEEDKPVREIIAEIKEAVAKTEGIQEQDTIIMVRAKFSLISRCSFSVMKNF